MTEDMNEKMDGTKINTESAFLGDSSIISLFEAQVKRTPDAPAVFFEGAAFTYNELNRRANRLAHHLIKLGVYPETLVAIHMERSLELMVGLLGILKAGGAYVPLDPHYPRERLSFMLEDTRAPVLLTQQHLSKSLRAQAAKVICLEREFDWNEKSAIDTEVNPASGTTSSNLAYVIFTSGSTGKPKGVMVQHGNVLNFFKGMDQHIQFDPPGVWLAVTTLSFDISVLELFWTLSHGFKVVLYNGEEGNTSIAKLIKEHNITHMQCTPSMAKMLVLTKDSKEALVNLDYLMIGGETFPVNLARQLKNIVLGGVFNMYGPTETTIWSSIYKLDEITGSVSIGRPVANTQIYILNPNLQPAPPGESGELHIGGVQVARGYLNRPELTAEKFIPDPFNSDAEARLYKTGDLARYLPDGNIEFQGRIDHQVKIRGFRIELGEIESVLVHHPAVQQVVVLAREFGPGDSRLVAYLVPDLKSLHPTLPNTESVVEAIPDGPKPSHLIETLRKLLEEKLPDYMMPAFFILMEEMPLTPNGKLDQNALPEPPRSRPILEEDYVSPRNELEQRLAEMWCHVLKLEQVGVHDRFFELGGDSILAALFINGIQKELNEFIYIVTIFESPTIAKYSKFLERDYSESVARWLGQEVDSVHESSVARETYDGTEIVDAAMVTRMRQIIYTMPKLKQIHMREERKNPSAIFILAPPRSGTTLLRVMLAGHPRLFAASELQLLCFHTLVDRKAAYTGKFSLWLEGTIRAIMELKRCDAEEAKKIMEDYEKQRFTTKGFFRVLQEWIDDSILVDKTPAYALDPEALKKAECDFENAFYIHLVRHPYATARSFESMHMDQVLYLKEHSFTARQLGELVWTVSHQNITEFLKQVPTNRSFRMRFEDLTSSPRHLMEALCQAMGLEFLPEMLDPYKGKEKKMIDGIYPDSTPMGDVRFHTHQKINQEVADRWKQVTSDNFLGDITWKLAQFLGYDVPENMKSSPIQSANESILSNSQIRKERMRQQRERRNRS